MQQLRILASSLLAVAVVAVVAGCAAATPEVDAAAPPSPIPTTSAPAVEAAASCLSIDAAAPTVNGATLGTCFADALHAVGSMKATYETGDRRQQADIRLRPDIAIHATTTDADGTSEVIFVDDVAYENDGTGWIRGDVSSDDDDEMVLGGVGELLVAVFAGDVLKQSIAACPVWNIEPGTTRITLPDSQVVETREFICAEPFESFGTTVGPMSVWIDEDWTPYGTQSTVTGFGQVVEGAQYYFDHGVEVDIVAPM